MRGQTRKNKEIIQWRPSLLILCSGWSLDHGQQGKKIMFLQYMRPKARGLAQHGGPPGWLKESDPAGVILYMVDGPYRLPFPYRIGCPDMSCPTAYWWNPSCCYIVRSMYTTVRHELRHARKAWPGTLVDPGLLSCGPCGWYLRSTPIHNTTPQALRGWQE